MECVCCGKNEAVESLGEMTTGTEDFHICDDCTANLVLLRDAAYDRDEGEFERLKGEIEGENNGPGFQAWYEGYLEFLRPYLTGEKEEFNFAMVPETYVNISEEMPLEIPRPCMGCGRQTDFSQGFLFSWIAEPEDAMAYDDVEGIIENLHETMDENTGLIEVQNGLTAAGNPFIYIIRKMRISMPDEPVTVSYILNMNVHVDGEDYFINGDFSEKGLTGQRDTLGLEIFRRALMRNHPEREITIGDAIARYNRDPYDPGYKLGFLMNFSERADLDETFPNHPLSEMRRYIQWVIESN